ncbi:MAG: glycosyltransferase family 39 protein [Candidatus Sungbacteria bacterium]|nr:glycosyltransferase family 39 protein [Candidatus Sungbacteria bacterium]
MEKNIQRIFFWGLMALGLFFFLFQLGSGPFYDYDEAYYAQVLRDTLDSGNFLTLQRFGSDWFEKPPLLFWLTALSVKIFGENEFAMRLPTALLGTGAIWGTYLLTFYLTKSFWASFLSGAILLFSGIFPASARQFRMDVPLAFVIVFALYSFVKGWADRKWFWGFWGFMALGIMLKSLPAFLSAPIAVIFSAAYGRWDWLKNWYFWLGSVLFLIIAAPWHIVESLRLGREFWDIYFIRHILERASSAVIGGNITNWDYLKHLLILNEPWFLLFLATGAFLVLYRKKQFPGFQLALASFISALFIFFIFAVAKTKLIFYLIPAFPFEAISLAAAALFLYHLAPGRYKKSVVVACGMALALGAASTSYQIFLSNVPYSYLWAAEEKQIGELIREGERGHKLYSFDWKAYDTIYYYSGRSYIELVEKDDLKTGFPPPYFLIMPKPYFKNTEQPGIRVRFMGNYLVLLEARGGGE